MVPPVKLKNLLPPNVAVPEPILLSVFQEFVEDLPIIERAVASKHFEKDLPWEMFAILAGDLCGDHYWVGRLMLLPESNL